MPEQCELIATIEDRARELDPGPAKSNDLAESWRFSVESVIAARAGLAQSKSHNEPKPRTYYTIYRLF